MKIILFTAPLIQVNTPYPATMQLVGYLQSQQVSATQADLSIELVDKLFTSECLSVCFDQMEMLPKLPKRWRQFLVHRSFVLQYVEAAVSFLRNQDPTLATRFAQPLI